MLELDTTYYENIKGDLCSKMEIFRARAYDKGTKRYLLETIIFKVMEKG